MTPLIVDMKNIPCKRCGDCCKNKIGIALMIYDIDRISNYFKINPKTFIRKYCNPDTWEISTKDGVCQFYDEKAGCTIEVVKPLACKLYPYHMISYSTVQLLKDLSNENKTEKCFVNDLPDDAILQLDEDSNCIDQAHLLGTDHYHQKIGQQWYNKEAHEHLQKANELLTKPELYNKLKSDVIKEFDATRAFVIKNNIITTSELELKINSKR